MSRTTTVDFEHPPLNEVVCGVTFDAVPGLSAGYLGLLWTDYIEENE